VTRRGGDDPSSRATALAMFSCAWMIASCGAAVKKVEPCVVDQPQEQFVVDGVVYPSFEALLAFWNLAAEGTEKSFEYDQLLEDLKQIPVVVLHGPVQVGLLERRHEGSKVLVLEGPRSGEIYWASERSLKRPEQVEVDGNCAAGRRFRRAWVAPRSAAQLPTSREPPVF
jgi:hypothetical protein